MGEQQVYQVRFDWAAAGVRAVGADADVVVWVDALGSASDAAGDGEAPPWSAAPSGAAVIGVGLADAAAGAQWIVERQQTLRRRLAVAVVAAGERRADGSDRFAVEDLLAAGALINRLVELGLDATSPEAAVAEAAYRDLRRAVGHLLTACVSAAHHPVPPEQRGVEPELGPAEVTVLRPGR